MDMEQVACFFCVILALLLPFLLLNQRKCPENGLRLPPSPWQLPIIGNLHQVMRGGPLVHRTMADLARRLDTPLIYLRLGEVPVVVASSPDSTREFMKTYDVNFASRPWTPTVRVLAAEGPGLGHAPYGALWRQLRKITIMELLSARLVQSFHRIREEEVRRAVAAVAATPPGEAVNVSERIAALVTDSMMRATVGNRFERREEFLENLAEGVNVMNLGNLFPSSRFAGFVLGTTRRAEAIRRKGFELMDVAIRKQQERRLAMAAGAADGNVEEEENLLGVLLRIQREGGLDVLLTMGTIKSVIIDLFIAGSDTTVHALQWAMSELMKNPRVMRKAQAELRESLHGKPTVTEDDLTNLKYIKPIIKETLRVHRVVPLLLPRECQESCKIIGYDIPKTTLNGKYHSVILKGDTSD